MIVVLTAGDETEVLVDVADDVASEALEGLGVGDSFEGLFAKARPIIDGIVRGLGDLDLDQIGVKFSMKVTGEGKILFIASGKVEGGIELTLTWKPKPAG